MLHYPEAKDNISTCFQLLSLDMNKHFILDKTWFIQSNIIKCFGFQPLKRMKNEDGTSILIPIKPFHFWFRLIFFIVVVGLSHGFFTFMMLSYEIQRNLH